MSQERNASKEKLEEELGRLLLSFVNAASDEEREQHRRFIELTLRRLIVVKCDLRAKQTDGFG